MISLRRLWPSDADAFRSHLMRLERDARHSRFMGGVSDAFVSDYVSRAFDDSAIMYGAFSDGSLIGVGELRPTKGGAEVAFSVDRTFRHGGIGTRLFRQIERSARAAGYEAIELTCCAENWPMRGLARKFSVPMSCSADGLSGRLALEIEEAA